jgi:hypothetical protein
MDADLTATPTFENGQVAGWQLCYKKGTGAGDCGDGKTSSPYPKLDFAKGSGDHNIKIDIVNGNGITFSQDPLWIQENTKPDSHVIAPTSQIDPSKITGAGTTQLTFHDKNSNKTSMLLKYRLNFTGGNGVMTLDPDITNGGKGFYNPSAILVISAGVALALALLVWRTRVSQRNIAASGPRTD